MGLSSVMQTALSGMNAATALVEVTSNNIANSQTTGFKAGSVHFAALAPQIFSAGSPPSGASAGANPIQVGRGVEIAATSRDLSQGTIATTNQPAVLALEGDGYFILQGSDGGRRYTRDGNFSLNADGDLISADGDRLLGFGVDAQGQIDPTQLRPLRVRLGSSVAGAGGGAATLRSFSLGRDGGLVGHYSDGVSRTIGQLRVARFANPNGLAARAGNKFESTPASGLASESDPGVAGAGEVIGGASELSNVDLGHELVELTLAGNLFDANLAVFHTADTLLGELFFPWRKN